MAQQSTQRPVMEEISRNLTPNFYITNNDVEIIDALVDNGEMFKDFSRSQVTSFLWGEDFALVLFFADDYDRGFTMYVVRDFSVNVRDMAQLIFAIDEILNQGYNYRLFHAARSKVEEMLYMAPTFRAMWDKADPEEEEDQPYGH